MRAFLHRHGFTLAVAASVAIACLWPAPFVSVGGWKLTGLVVPLIEVIMFGMGMTLRPSDFAAAARRPVPVALGAVLQFGVMPAAGLGVALLLGLDSDVATGVVLIGSVAGGVASNVIAYIAKANVALSVTMTAVSTCLAPLMTPLMMRIYAGRFVRVDAADMAVSLVQMVILPLAASQAARMLLRRRGAGAMAAVERAMPVVSMAGICAITLVSVAPVSGLFREAGAAVLLAAVIHNAIGYFCGYWGARLAGRFCQMDERDARTLAIEVGMQNGGMGTALAVGVLKSEAAALAPIVFGCWMDVSGSILAGWWGRHPPVGRQLQDREKGTMKQK